MLPLEKHDPAKITRSRFGWTIIAFIIAGVFISALMIWQLIETSPQAWCKLADDSSDNLRGACLSVLLKLLDVKDHTIVGLLTILGITVLSVVAVALNVRISAAGPGNTNVNIGANETRIQNGDVDVAIPTPPSEDK
jgi:hypothetical protein